MVLRGQQPTCPCNGRPWSLNSESLNLVTFQSKANHTSQSYKQLALLKSHLDSIFFFNKLHTHINDYLFTETFLIWYPRTFKKCFLLIILKTWIEIFIDVLFSILSYVVFPEKWMHFNLPFAWIQELHQSMSKPVSFLLHKSIRASLAAKCEFVGLFVNSKWRGKKDFFPLGRGKKVKKGYL